MKIQGIGSVFFFSVIVSASALAADSKLIIKTTVSQVGLQSYSLAQGKGPQDEIKITMSGHLFNPPIMIKAIAKNQVDRSTPEKASASVFSSFKADDERWILDNWADEDQAGIRKDFADPVARQRNKQFFQAFKAQKLFGLCHYHNYVILLVGFDNDTEASLPETYMMEHGLWKQTNALSGDATLGVLFGALRNGSITQTEEQPY